MTGAAARYPGPALDARAPHALRQPDTERPSPRTRLPEAARRSGCIAVALTAALTGCAGGQFQLDEPLRQTRMLRVEGPLGMNAYHCDPKTEARPEGLAAGQPASVTIGSLAGVAFGPRRELTTTRLFNEALLRDYERFLRRYHELIGALDPGGALAGLGAGRTPLPGLAEVEELLDAIHAVLLLPATTTETMRFGFIAKHDGRTIVAACASTDTVRTFGVFDGPRFSISCRIVPAVDKVPRDLRVKGYGTWASYGFSGMLRANNGESAELGSQSVTILGMGAIRGFDLRTAGRQTAAISFWQIPRGANGEGADAAAWMVPSPASPGWSDARMATLALSYLFPWPSACDDQYLRGEGIKTADPSKR